MQIRFLAAAILASLCGLSGCAKQTTAVAPAAATPPFQLTATIQDLMDAEVDPAADYLWESVGTTVTPKGVIEKAPHTDEEWAEARRRAIVLVEATNLLMMDGRRVATPGKALADEGAPGVLSAEEIQKGVDSDHAGFVGFAQALHGVGERLLDAVNKKDSQALLEMGDDMDSVCEACHKKFWYPNDVRPAAKPGSV